MVLNSWSIAGSPQILAARNIHGTFAPEQIQQLIYNNQTVTSFNIPSLPASVLSSAAPSLLDLIATGRLKLFAGSQFLLVSVKTAFEALASRKTMGK